MSKELKYTVAQEKAIKESKTNILVSAGAGSGKTLVLVQRILRLIIEEKAEIDRFLVVTFTNAAARNMKEKIREGLEKFLEDSNLDQLHLKRQLRKLNNSPISTMHSFCIDILRSYYQEMGIDPSFKILNSSQEEVLKSEALEKALEKHYENPSDDFLKLVQGYGGRTSDKLVDIFRIFDRGLESQIFPKVWINDAIRKEVSRGALLEFCQEEINSAGKLIQEAMEIAYMPAGPEPYLEALNSDYDQLESLKEKLNNNDYPGFIGLLAKLNFLGLSRKSKGINPQLRKMSKDKRDESKKILSQLANFMADKSQDKLERDYKIRRTYLDTIEEILVDYYQNLEKSKNQKKSLSFSDTEHLTLKILENEDIRDEIKSKIDYVFFDEYQDISPIQEEIIKRIAKKNNLFFVGDIKQSIYRFRLAEPKIFIDRYRKYRKNDGGKLIDLNSNFRSMPKLLRGINHIFSSLMTEEIGEIDYNEPGQMLEAGRNIEEDKTKISIVINERNPRERANDFKENPLYIAREIKKLVKQGYDYKDMAILIRSARHRVEDYEKVFDAMSIPYFSDISRVTFEDVEVSIFINMLRLIDNLRNDIALLSSITGPLGNFNEDEISQIRLEADGISFYDSLKEYLNVGEDDLKIKVQLFLSKISYFREKYREMKLSEFAYLYALESGYLDYISAVSSGDRKKENLLAFIDRIKEYEDFSYDSLPGLLRHIDNVLNSPSDSLDPKNLTSENENVVRIMTIHKSKGLEFKVVFLSELQQQFNYMDNKEDFLLDKDLGIGMNLVDLDRDIKYKDLNKFLIERKNRKDLKSEEMRLFYVGATRAEEVLYLVMTSDKSKDEVSGIENTIYKILESSFDLGVQKANSMGDWLLHVALRDTLFEEKLKDFSENLDRPSKFLKDGSYNLIFNNYEPYKLKEGKNFSLEFSHSLSKEEIKEIENIFIDTYDRSKVNLAYKRTVSEISSLNYSKTDGTLDFKPLEEDLYEVNLLENKPNILLREKVISPSEMGSLIHFVFRNISYRQHDTKSVEDELDRMVCQELISKEERSLLDSSVYVDFFKTDLAKRALTNLHTLERERSFTMKYGDIYLDGQVDGFFEEDGEIVLYDFKTDSRISPDKYKVQLNLYQEAIEKARGLKVKEKYLYWTRFNRISLI